MAESQETPHLRSYCYVGGDYHQTALGHVMEGQMYVEKLTPSCGCTRPYPIIFIQGGGQSGTNWLNKPDGGNGWASWFLEHGYEVYLIDHTATGRSPLNPKSNVSYSAFPAEYVQQRFTAVQNFSLWPQAHLHTQWPGSGMIGDPIFDKYYTSIIPVPTNQAFQEINMRNALIALLDKSGPAIVLTHSTGGLYGWSIADARPRLIKALIQVEPKGPPFREAIFSTRFTRPWGLTSIPLTYDPAPTDSTAPLTMKTIPTSDESRIDCILQEEPAKQLTNLREVPILIVTAEASYHATYDHSFKLFLEQAGCEKVEHLKLSDREIHGNGHLMFLEKNSDEIAGILEAWISGTVGKGGEAEGD